MARRPGHNGRRALALAVRRRSSPLSLPAPGRPPASWTPPATHRWPASAGGTGPPPYSSLPGLNQVVDVRLDPPSGDSGATEKHEYPTVWYREALPAKGNPPTGPWWSPLFGGDSAIAGRSYVHPGRATPTGADPDRPGPGRLHR